MICLTLLCLGIVAYGYYPQMTWCHLHYHLGRKMGEAMILWMIFSVTLGRKQGYKKGVLSFLLISAAGYTGGLISYTEGQGEVEQLKTEFRQVFAEATNSQQSREQTQRQTNSTRAHKGDQAELRRWFTTVINEMAGLRNDYERELTASGIENILYPPRLEHDRTLVESKMIVHNAKVVIAKYRTKMNLLDANVEDEIKKLRISAESKREALRGFNDSLKTRRAANEGFWQCEEGIASQFENIVALLSRRMHGWIIQNGEIHFLDERDSTEFNSYRNIMEHLLLKQEEIQKQNLETVEALLK
jgi:hypothetical protein